MFRHNRKLTKIKRVKSWFFQSSNEEQKTTESIYKEAPIEDIYRIDAENFEEILHASLADYELQCLFIVCIYTINNYCGSPGLKYTGIPSELFNYINELLRIRKSHKHDLVEKANVIAPPPYVLTVEIVEATGFIPTDPDGLSDPFCKLWVTENPNIKHQTTVIRKTVEPLWNESSDFPITYFEQNILHIELWDMDPQHIAEALAEFQHVRTFKGFLHFTAELKDSCRCWGRKVVDDFLGNLVINLRTLSWERMDQWFPLKNKKGETGHGEIHIITQICVTRPSNRRNSLKRHLVLFKMCFERAVQDMEENYSKDKMCTWEEIVPSSAIALLFQHALQSSVSTCEYCLMRWIVIHYFSQIYKAKINYELLYNSLNDIRNEFSFTTDIIVDDNLEDFFRDKLFIFNQSCYEFLDSLYTTGFLVNEKSCVDFEYLLRCIYIVVNMLYLERDPLIIIAEKTFEWYKTCANNTIEPSRESPETTSKSILSLLNSFYQCQINADDIIHKIYQNKTFTKITYENLWPLICTTLKPTIQKLIEDTATADIKTKDSNLKYVVEIIFYLGKLWVHAQSFCEESFMNSLDSYKNWFSIDVVEEWFEDRGLLIISNLQKIMKLDNFEMVNDNMQNTKVSSSVIEVMHSIEENLLRLRTLLICTESKVNVFLIENLYKCCLKYIGLVLNEIHIKKLFENFNNHGKTKLAVICNNFYTLGFFCDFKRFITDANLSNYPDAKSELYKQCVDLCKKIAEPRKIIITNLIGKIPMAKTMREQKTAVKTYEAYIVRLIWNEASTDMRFEVFCIFVKNLWDHIVTVVEKIKNIHKEKRIGFVRKISRCLRRINVYHGLLSALAETEKLVHTERECLPTKLVHTEQYLETRDELVMLSTQ